MKAILNFINLSFLPRSPDVALLVLRVWVGASMLLLHGWSKLQNFRSLQEQFADPTGLGMPNSLALALCVFAEVPCSIFIALGLLTRFAALVGAINMGVAFFLVHKMDIKFGTGGTGELAFLYLMAYVTLFISGPGRFGFDHQASPRKRPRPAQD